MSFLLMENDYFFFFSGGQGCGEGVRNVAEDNIPVEKRPRKINKK